MLFHTKIFAAAAVLLLACTPVAPERDGAGAVRKPDPLFEPLYPRFGEPWSGVLVAESVEACVGDARCVVLRYADPVNRPTLEALLGLDVADGYQLEQTFNGALAVRLYLRSGVTLDEAKVALMVAGAVER